MNTNSSVDSTMSIRVVQKTKSTFLLTIVLLLTTGSKVAVDSSSLAASPSAFGGSAFVSSSVLIVEKDALLEYFVVLVFECQSDFCGVDGAHDGQ